MNAVIRPEMNAVTASGLRTGGAGEVFHNGVSSFSVQ
jgi:hypothetical protein